MFRLVLQFPLFNTFQDQRILFESYSIYSCIYDWDLGFFHLNYVLHKSIVRKLPEKHTFFKGTKECSKQKKLTCEDLVPWQFKTNFKQKSSKFCVLTASLHWMMNIEWKPIVEKVRGKWDQIAKFRALFSAHIFYDTFSFYTPQIIIKIFFYS